MIDAMARWLWTRYWRRRCLVEEAHVFMRRYTEGKLTPRELLAHGRFPLPCGCGEKGCTGWQMAHVEDE